MSHCSCSKPKARRLRRRKNTSGYQPVMETTWLHRPKYLGREVKRKKYVYGKKAAGAAKKGRVDFEWQKEHFRSRVKPVIRKRLPPPSRDIKAVRAALSAAYKADWGHGNVRNINKAVRPVPREWASRVSPNTFALIFTEHAGLSQYDNGSFWRKAYKNLHAAGFHAENVNSGVIAVFALSAEP